MRIYAGDFKLTDRSYLAFCFSQQLSDEPRARTLPGFPLHIGLPGGHPDLSNQNVLQGSGVAGVFTDNHVSGRVAGLQRIKLYDPFPVVTCRRSFGLTGKGDGYGGSRFAPENREPPSRLFIYLIQESLCSEGLRGGS